MEVSAVYLLPYSRRQSVKTFAAAGWKFARKNGNDMNVHHSQESALLLRAVILLPNTQGSYEPAIQFFNPGSEISA